MCHPVCSSNKVVFYQTSPAGADIIITYYITMFKTNGHRYFGGPDAIDVIPASISHYIPLHGRRYGL